ncbi:transcriptional regulator [Carnobacterium gallinarum]|uniref:transcriptional regulator n=1 Tax=Carnobacterium gallinarum TaxID=2749 RepID=UPI0005595F13|nr:transcriptional regulator [Carnobacterium gallinarum]
MEHKLITEAVKGILTEAQYPVETEAILHFALNKMEEQGIYPTEVQLVVLTNHLGEMVRRSNENEAIMKVDPAMFSEVSTEALAISEDIMNEIGNLAIDEKYVLSIHFETAKQNTAN